MATASATWATTSTRRPRVKPPSSGCRGPARRTIDPRRTNRIAGSDAIAVITSGRQTMKAATPASIRTPSRRGTAAGSTATRPRTPHHASGVANAAAAALSASISNTAWRTSRPRPAPRAAWTASSPRRCSARISCRLATLAQATTSTSATAARSASRGWRELPATASSNRRTLAMLPCALVSGFRSAGGRSACSAARRLADGLARLQPRDQVDLTARRVAERAVRWHAVRRPPQFDAGRVVEIVGHHPDDGEAPLAEGDAPAEHGGRRRVARPPQPAGDHDDGLGPLDVVGRPQARPARV